MSFKLLEKKGVGKLYENEVSICKTYISFRVSDFFNEDYIEIYVNRKEKQMGFMPSSDRVLGFKITYNKRSCPGICHLNGFLGNLIGRYIGKKVGKMFVIKVDKLK